MELIKIIMGLISFQIEDIKTKLEVESKDNDIAYMQGKLRGLRKYKESIVNMVDSEVDEKKDYLFLDAENARALFLTHGERDGLFLSKKVMQKIVSQYDYRVQKEKERKEDEPLLEWIKDYDDVEGVVDSVENFEDLFIQDNEEVLN